MSLAIFLYFFSQDWGKPEVRLSNSCHCFFFSFYETFHFSIFFFSGLLKNPIFHRANIRSISSSSPAKALRRITHSGTLPGSPSLDIWIASSRFRLLLLKVSDEFSLLSSPLRVRFKLEKCALMKVGFHRRSETFTWLRSEGRRLHVMVATPHVLLQSWIVPLLRTSDFDIVIFFPELMPKGSSRLRGLQFTLSEDDHPIGYSTG